MQREEIRGLFRLKRKAAAGLEKSSVGKSVLVRKYHSILKEMEGLIR